MAETSHIEWTDATWNPVTGCSVVSPGCTNCYAMKLAGTRLQHHPSRAGLTQATKAGPVWTGEVRFNEQWLDQPLRWRRARRIFVCAHGDLFHEGVPDEWIDRVFAVMALCPQHTFQVLTKRADRMRAYLSEPGVVRRICSHAHGLRYQGAPDPNRQPRRFHAQMAQSASLVAWTVDGGCAAEMFRQKEPDRDYPSWVDWPLPNVWLGVSVEDQARADERIPDLLAAPAAVRFLSCEPLLGPLELGSIEQSVTQADLLGADMLDVLKGEGWIFDEDGELDRIVSIPKIDWVICGGESGPGARPMQAAWARSLRDQCAAAGVPFFFKQWGAFKPTSDCEHGEYMAHVGKKAAGRLLDGVAHDGMPV